MKSRPTRKNAQITKPASVVSFHNFERTYPQQTYFEGRSVFVEAWRPEENFDALGGNPAFDFLKDPGEDIYEDKAT